MLKETILINIKFNTDKQAKYMGKYIKTIILRKCKLDTFLIQEKIKG